MKKLLFIVLVAFAAWYGWKHYPEIMNSRRPSHEVVVVNNTGHTLERVRVVVDGQTFVKESLTDNDKVAFPFRVNNDASFTLVWQYADVLGERNWTGGMVPKGPMVQRHVLTIDGNGEVIYMPETKTN